MTTIPPPPGVAPRPRRSWLGGSPRDCPWSAARLAMIALGADLGSCRSRLSPQHLGAIAGGHGSGVRRGLLGPTRPWALRAPRSSPGPTSVTSSRLRLHPRILPGGRDRGTGRRAWGRPAHHHDGPDPGLPGVRLHRGFGLWMTLFTYYDLHGRDSHVWFLFLHHRRFRQGGRCHRTFPRCSFLARSFSAERFAAQAL